MTTTQASTPPNPQPHGQVAPIPLVVVVGPTASGKSGVAVALAKALDGEVLSADSVQVYRSFDIGTGKITREEMQGVPHHLLDRKRPGEPYDAACFQNDADHVIQDIHSRGKSVIVAGGTGLYIRALLHGLFDLPSDKTLRQELQQQIEERGSETMHRELQQVDPKAASWIAPRDKVRIVRALEVYQLSGRTYTEMVAEHGHREKRYPAHLIGIMPERKHLYATIEARITQMLQEGWSTEVESLRERGYDMSLKPMQAIGYRELNQMLDGALCPTETEARIRKSTKAYAKRQLTWFRKEDVTWYTSPHELLQDEELLVSLQQWTKDA
ncbi:MAG: tRNA (adenosine(37)-N6)-dimethylallyltransferase MiaA [Deltaproteobacteria bacterium]|nr:MAG: tRNA (adenosine(37)-N6)-dimethylallyltransferase MiaA [Deltaproteobacteria bacterium]